MSLVLVDAFATAVFRVGGVRERLVMELRYGLNGEPGRTYREIAEVLGCHPSRPRELHGKVVAGIGGDARWAVDPARGAAGFRSCAVTVHIATDVVGDPADPHALARLREFVDEAFPSVRPTVSAELLTGLADVSLETRTRLLLRRLCKAAAEIDPGDPHRRR